ncbi:type I-B CRISPR-associated protein Cas8b/Csh1 [Haloarcula nitratireducens]|uniref:Type I-B CRISPR-associated protein Cas8b/Csh1 n=1 Tax=Haloarcula nitratireducens TaxID=2487749 RepID=A0AAW4PFE6_9EURY|nr:type I-B CRISPR-associated protein Cas8b/Csh1 [Halomicroarcula nitratireducens]MBX0296792.1 type I-B CRISPR-associated protein Cas8b/Csh1 [Halomicroarcula nitratireducens]
MLSPEEFRDEYEGQLAEELPDAPVSSLRKLQYLYGKLYTLGTTGGGQYASYLTPAAANDLLDTDESLIVIRVDLSGDQPRLAEDETGPVQVTRYTKDLIPKVAHCYYQNRGSGIDHSISHKSGKNKSPERLGEYAKHRFTRWPTEDAVQEIAESHNDGWIIETLAAIGSTEAVVDKIKEQVRRQVGGDRTAILTVQIKTESDGDYRWPAEVDVLMRGMRAQRLSKLVSKNNASNSAGQAVDLITEHRTQTVGTAQDPLNYFLGKQVEKFPGLDIENAWRTHPLSEDGALTVMNAETFIEACTYRTFGAKVYYLPYFFGRPTAEHAFELYEMLYTAATEDDDKTPVEEAYEYFKEMPDEEHALRFYVSAVMPHQTSRYDVFGETMNGRLHYPQELAVEHNRIVSDTAAFNSGGDRTSPLPTTESWDILVHSGARLHSITSGWYFAQTFADRDDDDADADDPRIEALVNVLSGGTIAVETLLAEYVDRITSEEDDDNVEGFPSLRVAAQFAQLCALAGSDLDLLTTADAGKQSITVPPTYEEHTMQSAEDIQVIADGGNAAAVKLESFIEDTPALARNGTEDAATTRNDERRGAFLLGALVGAVGNYQEYYEDRSTTLVDQFPVKSITTTRIKKVTQEAVGKTLTYTRQDKKQGASFPGTKFAHIVDQLRESILERDPDEWEIETDDLRFYYALGVTYGMNDRPTADTQTAEEN